jgi:hypothetical protein
MTDDLKAMGLVLVNRGVKDVAMESTGVYWKPVHNVWEPMGLNVMIGNATHMKNVPGRKTDMTDSHWIAQLHRFGLIKPSFVPDGVFQRLRLLSRHRTNLVEDRSRVKNRVEKVLQDGNIKWSSIVSDTFGVAGMQILDLIADGVTNAQTLAASVTTKIKRKEDAQKALTNCLTREHIFVLKELLKQFRSIQAQILEVENELTERMLPYAHLVEEKDLGYKRGDPAEKQIEQLVRKLKSLGVDIRHENHQMIVNSVRRVKVDRTGIFQETFH